ncbi:MAG: gliding motility-associated C-terminal domain-containing protein [Crocinitomicaceae bacterium]
MKRLTTLYIFLILSAIGAKAQYTWYEQNSTTTDPIDAIYVAGPGNAYGIAGTENGKVLRSTDGQTWVQTATIPEVNSLTESDWIKGIYMEDLPSQNAMLVTRSGRVYVSTDAGSSWTYNYQTFAGLANDMTNGDDRIAFTAGDWVFWTDDFGVAWDSAAVPMIEAIGISYADDQSGFISGINELAFTTDGGANWTLLSGFNPTSTLYSIHALSNNSFVAVGEDGYCCKYVSGTWTYPDLVGTTENMFDIHFGNGTHGVVVGDNNYVFQTDDGGATWTQDSPSSSNTTAFYRVHCQNNEFAWIGGSEGQLYGSPFVPVDIDIIDLIGPDTLCKGESYNYQIKYIVTDGIAVNPAFQVLLNSGNITGGGYAEHTGTFASPDTFILDLTHTINLASEGSYNYIVNAVPNTAETGTLLDWYGLTENEVVYMDTPDPHSVSGPHVFCPGDLITIEATGGDSYNWLASVDDPFLASNIVFPIVDTKYAVVIEQEYCTIVDTVYAFIGDDCDVEPPIIDTVLAPAEHYAFTPNGDNTNDYFVLDFLVDYPVNNVAIFNRWGDLIQEFNNYDNETIVWDGTYNGVRVGAGTYYFTVEYNAGESYAGWVQVVE